MKTIAIIVIAVIVIAGGGILLAKSHNNKSTPSTTSSSSSSTKNSTSSSSGSSSTPTATNAVEISNFAFSPADITVKAGTTVTWTNKDSVAHTVTETDGKTGPASSDLNQGQTYSFTYNTTGSFKYHCSIHSNMVGTVTVTN